MLNFVRGAGEWKTEVVPNSVTPFQQFHAFYRPNHWDVLGHYFTNHYVYSSPTAICLAKPDGDTWFIEYYAGDLREVFNVLPYWLTYVSFFRNGRYRCYTLAAIAMKIIGHETVKDNRLAAVEP